MRMNANLKFSILNRLDEICQKYNLIIMKTRFYLKPEEQPSFLIIQIKDLITNHRQQIFLNEDEEFIEKMIEIFNLDSSDAEEFYHLITDQPQFIITEFFKFKEVQFKEYKNNITISKNQPYSFFYNESKISKLSLNNYNFDFNGDVLVFMLDNLSEIKKSFQVFCFEKKIKEDALLEEFIELIKYATYSSNQYEDYLFNRMI